MFDHLAQYDVFNTYLLHDAEYAGALEMPVLHGTCNVPKKLVPFSKAVSKSFRERGCWVCFYEHDIKFVRFWRHPEKYMNRLLEFQGIISPDFSMYRNMPAIMQYWSCFMGRALAHRYEMEGGRVIPNVRLSDIRSHEFCLVGVPTNSTVAVGTHGCIKHHIDRNHMAENIAVIVEKLQPRHLVVYGRSPDDIFAPAYDAGIPVTAFESQFSLTHKKVDIDGDR